MCFRAALSVRPPSFPHWGLTSDITSSHRWPNPSSAQSSPMCPCCPPALCFFFFFNSIDIQLIYNVVLVSGMQENESVPEVFFFFFLVIPKCNPHTNTVLSYRLKKNLFLFLGLYLTLSGFWVFYSFPFEYNNNYNQHVNDLPLY